MNYKNGFKAVGMLLLFVASLAIMCGTLSGNKICSILCAISVVGVVFYEGSKNA